MKYLNYWTDTKSYEQYTVRLEKILGKNTF